MYHEHSLNSTQYMSASTVNQRMSQVYLLQAIMLGLSLLTYAVASASGILAFLISSQTTMLVLALSLMAFALAVPFVTHKLGYETIFALGIGYSVVIGLFVGAVVSLYTTASVIAIFLTTVALFAVMSGIGYFTRADLTRMGPLLSIGAIAVVIGIGINLLLGSSMLSTIISLIAIPLLLAMVAYESQALRNFFFVSTDQQAVNKATALGALTLYMSLVAIFTHLLNLLGQRE